VNVRRNQIVVRISRRLCTANVNVVDCSGERHRCLCRVELEPGSTI
jgi:hypothetical protein